MDALGRADQPVTVSGRLIGGCIETLSNLGGSAYADVAGFARDHAPEGLLVYVEVCDADAYDIARRLHGSPSRRSRWPTPSWWVAPQRPATRMTSWHGAVLDALGGLGVPLVADVECGHVAPHLPLVNGALAELRLVAGDHVPTADADRAPRVRAWGLDVDRAGQGADRARSAGGPSVRASWRRTPLDWCGCTCRCGGRRMPG